MSESIYDEKIAPVLAKVMAICQEHEIPIMAVAEYEPGCFGETRVALTDQHMAMTMAYIASRSRGNLDSFVISLLRYCKRCGIDTSASMVANLMTGNAGVGGVPHG